MRLTQALPLSSRVGRCPLRRDIRHLLAVVAAVVVLLRQQEHPLSLPARQHPPPLRHDQLLS